MDWELLGRYLLLFFPVFAGIALTIVVHRMTQKR